MSLFGKKEKEEIARLNAEMQSLRDAMPSESRTLDDINREIKASREELARVQEHLESRNSELKDALEELQQAKDQLIETNEEVLMQSFGLYTPRYSFMNADEYKAHLLEIRAKQKDMIKAKTAVSGNMNWTVDGNASKGKKMVSDMQKLLLRAFNSECDDVIEHVKYNNIEASEKRITTSREAISKLGTIMEVSIQPQYYRLKIEELHLAFEYAQKKQQEKEEQKEARARMREEAKLAKEIEEERKKLEKNSSITRMHCSVSMHSLKWHRMLIARPLRRKRQSSWRSLIRLIRNLRMLITAKQTSVPVMCMSFPTLVPLAKMSTKLA